MNFCQRFSQVEPDADAIAGECALHEPAEQLRLLLLGYADTCVFNTDNQTAVGESYLEDDVSMTGGIFESIRQDIINHLVQMGAIYKHHSRLLLRQELVVDLLIVCYIPEALEYVFQEFHHVRFFKSQSQLVILHLSEFQQLIDQPKHPAHTLVHTAHRLPHLGRDSLLFFDTFHCSSDNGQRRTEFV